MLELAGPGPGPFVQSNSKSSYEQNLQLEGDDPVLPLSPAKDTGSVVLVVGKCSHHHVRCTAILWKEANQRYR